MKKYYFLLGLLVWTGDSFAIPQINKGTLPRATENKTSVQTLPRKTAPAMLAAIQKTTPSTGVKKIQTTESSVESADAEVARIPLLKNNFKNKTNTGTSSGSTQSAATSSEVAALQQQVATLTAQLASVQTALAQKANATDVVQINTTLDGLNNRFVTTDSFDTKVDSAIATKGFVTANSVTNMLNDSGIVTESALQQKGFVTNTELAAKNYVSNTELAEDLRNYARNRDVQDALNGYSNAVESNYVTNAELAAKGFVTDTELETKLEAKNYATKQNLNNRLKNFTKTEDMNAILAENTANVNSALDTLSATVNSNFNTLNADIATNRQNLEELSGNLNTTNRDLTALTNTVSSLGTTTDGLTADLSNYVTETELEAANYATISSLDDYVKKTDMKDTNGNDIYVATTDIFTNGKIDISKIPDLSNTYATASIIDGTTGKIDISKVPDLSDTYATASIIDGTTGKIAAGVIPADYVTTTDLTGSNGILAGVMTFDSTTGKANALTIPADYVTTEALTGNDGILSGYATTAYADGKVTKTALTTILEGTYDSAGSAANAIANLSGDAIVTKLSGVSNYKLNALNEKLEAAVEDCSSTDPTDCTPPAAPSICDCDSNYPTCKLCTCGLCANQ